MAGSVYNLCPECGGAMAHMCPECVAVQTLELAEKEAEMVTALEIEEAIATSLQWVSLNDLMTADKECRKGDRQ